MRIGQGALLVVQCSVLLRLRPALNFFAERSDTTEERNNALAFFLKKASLFLGYFHHPSDLQPPF